MRISRLILLTLTVMGTKGAVAEPADVSLELLPERVRVRWTTPPGSADHALTTRRWQLERSTTLNDWIPEGPESITTPGRGAGSVIVEVPRREGGEFFRVFVRDEPAFLAPDGGDVWDTPQQWNCEWRRTPGSLRKISRHNFLPATVWTGYRSM